MTGDVASEAKRAEGSEAGTLNRIIKRRLATSLAKRSGNIKYNNKEMTGTSPAKRSGRGEAKREQQIQ